MSQELLVLGASTIALAVIAILALLAAQAPTKVVLRRHGRFSRRAGLGIHRRVPFLDTAVPATGAAPALPVPDSKPTPGDAGGRKPLDPRGTDQLQGIIAGLRGSVDPVQRTGSDRNVGHVMHRALLTHYFDMLKEIGPLSNSRGTPARHRRATPGESTMDVIDEDAPPGSDLRQASGTVVFPRTKSQRTTKKR